MCLAMWVQLQMTALHACSIVNDFGMDVAPPYHVAGMPASLRPGCSHTFTTPERPHRGSSHNPLNLAGIGQGIVNYLHGRHLESVLLVSLLEANYAISYRPSPLHHPSITSPHIQHPC